MCNTCDVTFRFFLQMFSHVCLGMLRVASTLWLGRPLGDRCNPAVIRKSPGAIQTRIRQHKATLHSGLCGREIIGVKGRFTRANSLECAVRCETREEDAAGRAAAAVAGPPGGSAFSLTTCSVSRVSRLAAQNTKNGKVILFMELTNLHEI